MVHGRADEDAVLNVYCLWHAKFAFSLSRSTMMVCLLSKITWTTFLPRFAQISLEIIVFIRRICKISNDYQNNDFPTPRESKNSVPFPSIPQLEKMLIWCRQPHLGSYVFLVFFTICIMRSCVFPLPPVYCGLRCRLCCYTFSPTNYLLIENHGSLIDRYTSQRLWNQLPDLFRQRNKSCLDSPPHSLVSPFLSSSPLSASITPSLSL